MLSSKEIIFAPGERLEPDVVAEIAVAWPRLLDDRIHLQLVLQVTITATQDGVAEGRIVTYDFRTHSRIEAEQES
jgi:hypothetical protein